MKNGYKGADPKELISNYKKNEDKIIIEFLDNTKYEIPLTDENEAKLLKQMLEQAKDRDNQVLIYDIEKLRNKALINMFIYLGLDIINAISSCGNDDKAMKIFNGIVGSVVSICAFVCGVAYELKNAEIKELKKYHLYLSMREELEKNTDPNLFEGISKKTLNINTLDDYSLKEIRKLRDNLTRSEKYSGYFSNDSKNPTLIKK